MRMGLWPCRAPMKRGSVSSAGKNRACTDKQTEHQPQLVSGREYRLHRATCAPCSATPVRMARADVEDIVAPLSMLMVKLDRDRAFSQRCRSEPSYLVDRAAVVWLRRRGVGVGHANRRGAATIAGRACWRVILVALLERENIQGIVCAK